MTATAWIGWTAAGVLALAWRWVRNMRARVWWALPLVFIAAPAFAGPPESTARAPMPADVAPTPLVVAPVAPDVTEAARVQAALAAFAAGLANAQAGVASSPLLKPWSETRTGQIVLGCVAGAIVITSAGATTAGLLSTWPR